jgi:DNA polymerase III subunit epsilon
LSGGRVSIGGFDMDASDTLKMLDVMILDCQATGASPARGHLLEVAWSKTRAGVSPHSSRIVSHLVQLPPGARIPKRISILTGIEPRMMKAALPAKKVWRHLSRVLETGGPTPLVAHYARFETPFLQKLETDHGGSHSPSIQIVCTHEIARRLFPTLPRRSLRALAGYFGHHTPECKRAADHVRASMVIWRELVSLLDRECGVETLDDLEQWLKDPPPKREARRGYPINRDRRLSLPKGPGVYHLLGPREEVLYVGKATSLKARVNSYFQKQKGHNERALEMLTRVQDVRITETGSALEAALLEVDEIKRHDPPYNSALKDTDPRVWFFSADLGHARSRPDRRYSAGPLPSRGEVAALGQLSAWLRDRTMKLDAGSPASMLHLPRHFAPDLDCFRKGLSRFRALHPESSPSALVRLGASLWLGDPQAETDEPEESRRGFTWSPEAVTGALEGIVLRASHLVRRGAWLCWLCESELTWDAHGTWRQILVHRGRPLQTVKSLGPQAGPDRFQRTRRERKGDFDAATLDRLRVLTTELKRLVSDERSVAVRLAPRIRLERPGLAKVLRWL